MLTTFIWIKNGTNGVVPEKYRGQLRLAGKNAALNWKKSGIYGGEAAKSCVNGVELEKQRRYRR